MSNYITPVAMAEYYQLSALKKYINMYFFSFAHLEIQEQGAGRYVLCLMSPLPGLQWLILVFPVSSHDLSSELNIHTITPHQTTKLLSPNIMVLEIRIIGMDYRPSFSVNKVSRFSYFRMQVFYFILSYIQHHVETNRRHLFLPPELSDSHLSPPLASI